jgi:hypothetical protein
MYNVIRLFKLAHSLINYAASDVPEYLNKWVNEDRRIKSLDKLTDIHKVIKNYIPDFRNKVELDFSSSIEEYTKKLENLIDSSIEGVMSNTDNEDIIFIGYLIKEQSETLSKSLKLNKKISYTSKTIRKDKKGNTLPFLMFKINSESTLKQVMDAYKSFIKNIAPSVDSSQLNFISNKKRSDMTYNEQIYADVVMSLSQKSQILDVVFSIDPKDILGMSSRSDWTSCQNAITDKNQYNRRVVDSCINPNVGIIYLTNNKDFNGRGEKMVARSQVFLLDNVFDIDKKMIVVGNVYTTAKDKYDGNPELDYIKDIFIREISKNTSLPVSTSSERNYRLNTSRSEPYLENDISTKDVSEKLKYTFINKPEKRDKSFELLLDFAKRKDDLNAIYIIDPKLDIDHYYNKSETFDFIKYCVENSIVSIDNCNVISFLNPENFSKILSIMIDANYPTYITSKLLSNRKNENKLSDDVIIKLCKSSLRIVKEYIGENKILKLLINNDLDTYLSNDLFAKEILEIFSGNKLILAITNDVLMEKLEIFIYKGLFFNIDSTTAGAIYYKINNPIVKGMFKTQFNL